MRTCLRFPGRAMSRAVTTIVVVAAAAYSSHAQDQSRVTMGPANYQTIGSGKVVFSQTLDGQWLEFTPVSRSGESLLSGGGFVVYADREGVLTEIIHTAKNQLHVSTRVMKSTKY